MTSFGPRTVLIVTVGTSLLGNLKRHETGEQELSKREVDERSELGDGPETSSQWLELVEALKQRDGVAVGKALSHLYAVRPSEGTDGPAPSVLGAEFCSVASLVRGGEVRPETVFLMTSDTKDGKFVAEALVKLLSVAFGLSVNIRLIEGLQDEDPHRFKTVGLRNLARELGKAIRNYGSSHVAINATGGYKAQIAVSQAFGQAVGVPVYYQHERFQEIISFPPLPLALDMELWASHASLFEALQSEGLVSQAEFKDDWDERLDSLIECEDVEGAPLLALTAMGQIFVEAAASWFQKQKGVPDPVPPKEKRPPRIEDSGHMEGLKPLRSFLQKVTEQCPFVRRCSTIYYNPDLPRRSGFLLSRNVIVGIWSDGRRTVKFTVDTSAPDLSGRLIAVQALNELLPKLL